MFVRYQNLLKRNVCALKYADRSWKP